MPDPRLDFWWERVAWLAGLVMAAVLSAAAGVGYERGFTPSEVTPPDPALVIVTDMHGVRVSDAAIETAASKLEPGQWTVQAIPQPGQSGWTRAIAVSEGPVVPVPPGPPQPPVPPGPEPPIPPVTEGKRAALIIREASEPTPEFSRLLVGLRTGTAADYLKSKGHTLSILDDDSVNEAGQPSPAVVAWQPFYAGMQLPALLVIDPASRTLLHKEPIAPTATAESILATIKGTGG